MTRAVPAPRATGPAAVAAHTGTRDGLVTAAGWSFALYAAALAIGIAPMYIAIALSVAITFVVWLTRPGPRWARSPVDLPALAWLAAMGVATIASTERAASAASLGKGVIPLLTGLFAWHATDRRRGGAAVAALLAAGGIAAIFGCARFFAAGGRFPARAIGFSGTWMVFGLQMMLLVCLAAGIAVTARSRAWRIGALAAATTGAAGLALSFTRSAWLGLGAALALMLGLRRPRALLVLAAAAVIAYVALPGDFGDRLRSAFDPRHPSSRERLVIWETGTRVFRDHPITGVGIQNLVPTLDRYRSPTATEHPAHLHDSYLHVAVTTGILGLVAFFALIVALLRTTGSGPPGLRRGSGLAAGVRLGATAGAVGFLVAALTDHPFGEEPLLFHLFTLAGLAWAARGWGDAPGATRGVAAAREESPRG